MFSKSDLLSLSFGEEVGMDFSIKIAAPNREGDC